jgi:transcriptional regulator GlxA family with amidase domain
MAPTKKQIAVVLYPGMTALDVVGMMEVLVTLNVRSSYRVVTVAERIEPIPTDTSLTMVPNKTFAELSAPFGLILPGGGATALTAGNDDALWQYVLTAGASAELVAASGTGSLILAQAGLLADRRATTHHAFAQELNEFGARYVRRRWVDDDGVITAAGVTAGIDMALYLVAKLTSVSRARTAQLVIEYDPQPPFGGIDWDRVDQDAAARKRTERSRGDAHLIFATTRAMEQVS